MRYLFIYLISLNLLPFNHSVLFGQNELVFTLYLIGDAGLTAAYNGPVDILSRELKSSHDQKNTAVVFLGDNIYEFGWREKGNSNKSANLFRIDSLIIASQIKLLEDYKGQVYFVPGNHDWEKGKKGGYEVVINEQKNLDNLLSTYSLQGGFYPKAGNPGPYVVRFDSIKVALIMIDSQWLIQKVVKYNVGGDGDEREQIFESELINQLKQLKKEGFRIVLNAHHPLYSIGSHTKKGFLLLRAVKRWNSQNLGTKLYSKYSDLLVNIIKESEVDDYTNLIMAFGHDHNLQYWGGDKSYHHIVSGSGAKATDYIPEQKHHAKHLMTSKEGDASFGLKYPEIETNEIGRKGYFKIEFFENNFKIHVLDISTEVTQVFPSLSPVK